MSRIRASIRLIGEVTGVGFRAWAARLATKMGLAGFARNEPDGSLYIVVEGEETSVHTFLMRCRSGPPFAKVERTEVTFEEPKEEGDGEFEVVYSDIELPR